MRSNLTAVHPYSKLVSSKELPSRVDLTLTSVMSDVNDIRTTSSGHLVCDATEVRRWAKFCLPSNLIYKDECLFVCLYVCTLYKSTFLNRSEPNFAHVSSVVWKRPQDTYGPTIFHLPQLFGLFRGEGLHDAAQKWLPAPRGIPQNVISVTPARVRVKSRTRRRGALHILTARVVLCGWCVENAEKITVRTRVNVETG